MSSLNKVMLIGRLGRDPEMRYFPNGDGVCNFSMATSETWNDRQSGNRTERTEWHNISLRGRVAEVAGKYLKKGSLVLIEGKIQSRKYNENAGQQKRFRQQPKSSAPASSTKLHPTTTAHHTAAQLINTY